MKILRIGLLVVGSVLMAVLGTGCEDDGGSGTIATTCPDCGFAFIAGLVEEAPAEVAAPVATSTSSSSSDKKSSGGGGGGDDGGGGGGGDDGGELPF